MLTYLISVADTEENVPDYPRRLRKEILGFMSADIGKVLTDEMCGSR